MHDGSFWHNTSYFIIKNWKIRHIKRNFWRYLYSKSCSFRVNYQGRDVAEKIGLTIVGTIGILIQAFNKKMLTSQEIELGLKQLKEAGRFISDDIYSYIRKIISGT